MAVEVSLWVWMWVWLSWYPKTRIKHLHGDDVKMAEDPSQQQPNKEEQLSSSSPPTDDPEQGILGAILAGITKSIIYGLKSIPRTLVKASLHKQAFLTLSRRTLVGSAYQTYRYDGKKIVAPKKITMRRRGREFAKGSLLGFVVFTVYDILMHRDFEEDEAIVHDSTAVLMCDRRLVWMHSAIRPNSNDAPLIAHCGAGAISGMAFSIVLDGWDFVRRAMKKGREKMYRKLNVDFLCRRLVHHTLGYATLFGSFECFRRLLVDGLQLYFVSGHSSVPVTLQYAEHLGLIEATGENQYDMTAVPMLTAFLAGGFAGQAHFVADHYTRTWKLQAIKKTPPSANTRLPLRPMMASFLPTALCFVAFQYGAELYDHMTEDEKSSYAYPDNQFGSSDYWWRF